MERLLQYCLMDEIKIMGAGRASLRCIQSRWDIGLERLTSGGKMDQIFTKRWLYEILRTAML